MKKEVITNKEHGFSLTLHLTEEGFCCCPVCGSISPNKQWRPYDSNGVPSYDICECNFQFGYDDGDYPGPYDSSWKTHRKGWLNSTSEGNATSTLTLGQKKEQLKNIGVLFD